MGHPNYQVTAGSLRFTGTQLSELGPEERARAGLFLSFQYPLESGGVGFSRFLRAAHRARFPANNMNILEFHQMLKEKATEQLQQALGSNPDMWDGGERTRFR